ncbi:22913_t:CDS:2, partial [Dentiscutata erythropus]
NNRPIKSLSSFTECQKLACDDSKAMLHLGWRRYSDQDMGERKKLNGITKPVDTVDILIIDNSNTSDINIVHKNDEINVDNFSTNSTKKIDIDEVLRKY